MHRSVPWPVFVIALLLATPVAAEPLQLTSRADSEIIVTVAMADRLRDDCAARGDQTTAQRTTFATWERTNHVARVRAEIARLDADPASRPTIQQLRRSLDSTLAPAQADPCGALDRLVALPDARFAARAERLTAAAATAPPPGPTPAPRATADASAGAVRTLAQQIEGFGFATRPTIGYGGMVILDIYPIVMFRNGQALTDVEGLGFAGGADAHRRAHPEDWTQWRRAGGELQTMKNGAWAKLPFNTMYARVPAGFTLSGRYSRTGGTGNIAMGGADAVTTWETYDFSPDGRVVKGGGAGATATGGDFTTVARSVSADRRGRYAIDGITLIMTYENGARESAILVTDPRDPKVVWLNGRGFRRIGGR